MVTLPASGDRDDVVDLPVVRRIEVQPAPGSFGPLSLQQEDDSFWYFRVPAELGAPVAPITVIRAGAKIRTCSTTSQSMQCQGLCTSSGAVERRNRNCPQIPSE